MKSAKQEIRRRVAAQLGGLTRQQVESRSRAIRQRLLYLPELRTARSVFTYVSFGQEVETHDLILDLLATGTVVAVPRITGLGIMEAHRIRSLDDLAADRFGILAPRAPDLLDGSPAVTICPGLAFTERGERLGRGQAYYDRYLALHPGTFAIALAFEEQVLDELPIEKTDRHMRILVTEKRVVHIS